MQHQHPITPRDAMIMLFVGLASFPIAYAIKPGAGALVVGVLGFVCIGMVALWGLAFVIVSLLDTLFPQDPPAPLNPGAFGTAAWMDDGGKLRLTKNFGLIVGMWLYFRQGSASLKAVRYTGDAHAIVVAPSGAGKGVGCVIPAVLTHPGSCIVLDLSGEVLAVTGRYRREIGQSVHVIDPMGISGHPDSGFNPLDFLDPNVPKFVGKCRSIAASLVYDPPARSGDAHWNEAASELVASVIAYVAVGGAAGPRSLASVRELLTQEAKEFDDLFEAMADHGHAFVSRGGKQMLQRADRETSAIISSAQRHTAFLDDPRMADSLSRSGVDFRTIKSKPATVYLVLPPDELRANYRWYRLLVTEAINAVSSDKTRTKHKVLFILDEMAQLGAMEPFKQGLQLLRKNGLQLWNIVQDLGQLKNLYGSEWETFISNSAVRQFFGVNDVFTAQYVSKMLGKETIEVETDQDAAGVNRGGQPRRSRSSVGRDLMTPDEVMHMSADHMITFIANERPAFLLKPIYYSEEAAEYFGGRFDDNPYVG